MTSEEPTRAEPLFAITGGHPTPAEFAALSVVLEGMVEELGAAGTETASARPNGWRLRQRPMRKPIIRGLDSWRNFS